MDKKEIARIKRYGEATAVSEKIHSLTWKARRCMEDCTKDCFKNFVAEIENAKQFIDDADQLHVELEKYKEDL